jgi:hypothetical protein
MWYSIKPTQTLHSEYNSHCIHSLPFLIHHCMLVTVKPILLCFNFGFTEYKKLLLLPFLVLGFGDLKGFNKRNKLERFWVWLNESTWKMRRGSRIQEFGCWVCGSEGEIVKDGFVKCWAIKSPWEEVSYHSMTRLLSWVCISGDQGLDSREGMRGWVRVCILQTVTQSAWLLTKGK